MSKKHGQRKRRRKAHAKPCPLCRARAGASPANHLAALAAVLNAAEEARRPVRSWHGGVLLSEAGLLLPPVKRGKRWEVRPLRQDPLAPVWDPDAEDD